LNNFFWRGMDFSNPLERKWIPKAALSTQRGPSLLGDVVEHEDVGESDDENDVGYFSMVRHDPPELSPFGRVYYALDQLTSYDTFCLMKRPPGRAIKSETCQNEEQLAKIEARLREVGDAMLSHLEHVAQLLKVQDKIEAMRSFLETLLRTFRCPSAPLVLSEQGWITLTLVYLMNSRLLTSEDFDSGLVSIEDLFPYRPTLERFNALSSVFDEARFSGDL